MFHSPLMLWVNRTIADKIHTKDNKFVTGEKIKVAVDLKLNYNPGMIYIILKFLLTSLLLLSRGSRGQW